MSSHKLDLTKQLIKTSFKLRYNNSILGIVWVILKPLLSFIILNFAWTALFGQAENYSVRLLIGIICFTFLNEGVILGMNSLLDKAGIILKINFDRKIAVVSSTFMAIINLCINMIIFIIISFGLYLYKGLQYFPNSFEQFFSWSTSILYGLACLTLIYILSYAISLILSVIVPKLRDLQNVTELFFTLFIWLTPVMVRSADIKDKASIYYKILINNPVGIIIETVRAAFIDHQIVNLNWILIYLLFGIVLVLIANKYFNSKIKYIAEYF